jgi:RNase H-fold protein (predicted Holliday junction resolvase)
MSKRAVDAFIENLLYVDPTLVVKKVDEEYSSVVADAKLEKYQK